MTATAAGPLPTVALNAITPRELERGWSGACSPPLWQGRLGDGCALTIELGSGADLLFTYADRARFRLHADHSTLDCAPSQSGLHWRQALLGKVLPIVSVIRGYEALHAAVVQSPDGVVAIAAPSGTGKSTLAVELLRRGWLLFADDALILERDADGVLAHAGTPHMNLPIDRDRTIDDRNFGRTLGILAGERWLAVGKTAERTSPVRMVCLLQRGSRLPLEVSPAPSNPLLLAPYMLGLFSDPQRRRNHFSLYGDLIDSTTLVRLTAGPEHGPEQIADLLEEALERPLEPAAGALV